MNELIDNLFKYAYDREGVIVSLEHLGAGHFLEESGIDLREWVKKLTAKIDEKINFEREGKLLDLLIYFAGAGVIKAENKTRQEMVEELLNYVLARENYKALDAFVTGEGWGVETSRVKPMLRSIISFVPADKLDSAVKIIAAKVNQIIDLTGINLTTQGFRHVIYKTADIILGFEFDIYSGLEKEAEKLREAFKDPEDGLLEDIVEYLKEVNPEYKNYFADKSLPVIKRLISDIDIKASSSPVALSNLISLSLLFEFYSLLIIGASILFSGLISYLIWRTIKINKLIKILKDKREGYYINDTKKYAKNNIVKFGRNAVPALIKALPDFYAKQYVVEALGEIGPAAKKAVPILLKDYNYCSYIGTAIAKIRDCNAIGPLLKILKEYVVYGPRYLDYSNVEYYRSINQTIIELVNYSNKDTISILVNSLRDNDWLIQKVTADALGKIGKEAENCIPILLEILKTEKGKGYVFREITCIERVGVLSVITALECIQGSTTELRVMRCILALSDSHIDIQQIVDTINQIGHDARKQFQR